MNKTAKDRLMLKQNSPAKVLGIFPPHMELASINKKGKENAEPIIGMGNLYFIKFKEKKIHIGRENIPNMVINLNAI